MWNAWLSTLGHAPMLDPTDFIHSMGANHAAEGLSNAVSHAAASPFVAQATAAASQAAQVRIVIHPAQAGFCPSVQRAFKPSGPPARVCCVCHHERLECVSVVCFRPHVTCQASHASGLKHELMCLVLMLQGAVDLAERLPSCLLEKVFSKSLDVLSPLAAVERSPSQLLENALSLPRADTLDLVLERLQSHRL